MEGEVEELIKCNVCWRHRQAQFVLGVLFDARTPIHMCLACYSHHRYETERTDSEAFNRNRNRNRNHNIHLGITHVGALISLCVCPHCGHGIQKTSGCDIVRCRCGGILHFVTGEKLDEEHYGECADTHEEGDGDDSGYFIGLSQAECMMLMGTPFFYTLFAAMIAIFVGGCCFADNPLRVVCMAAAGLLSAYTGITLAPHRSVAWAFCITSLLYGAMVIFLFYFEDVAFYLVFGTLFGFDYEFAGVM